MSAHRRVTGFLAAAGRWVLAAGLLLAGCQNAGTDRVLSISSTASVEGFAYFDADGDRTFGAADQPLAGLRVRLVALGTPDTIAKAASDTDGRYAFSDVPVGSYQVVVDTTDLGDSLRVVRGGTSELTLAPGDSASLVVAVSYPRVTVAEARALAIGTKVFVEGVALNSQGTFSDTTVHLAGDSGVAIRATRVRRVGDAFAAGDAMRLLGTRSTRFGQPVLDDVTPFRLGVGAPPIASALTTAAAATAGGGAFDAQLVGVANAMVLDTAVVLGNRRLTVDDGSGMLVVVLDHAAGAFRDSLYVPGRSLDIAGLLVPTSAAGVWWLKPRSDADIVRR